VQVLILLDLLKDLALVGEEAGEEDLAGEEAGDGLEAEEEVGVVVLDLEVVGAGGSFRN
jgi:hypothetical protein